MVIPALLTDNKRIAEERVKLAKQMGGCLHIDMLDKTLYQFESLGPETLQELDFSDLSLQLHCMVNDPMQIVESGLPFERLIMHYEMPNWQHTYNQLITQGVETWIALDPATPIETLALPEDLSGVLILGVPPGQSGQTLLPDTQDRIIQFKDYYPDVPITIDGGVNESNLRDFIALGVDNIVMGSGIFGQKDPLAAYERLVTLSDPIAGQGEAHAKIKI